MARLASIAVGGYYPTPKHLMTTIAELINAENAYKTSTAGDKGNYVVLDPCAGKGEAIIELANILFPKDTNSWACPATVVANEMELTRYRALSKDLRSYFTRNYTHHCDAFNLVQTAGTGASILYLNPPYDTDKTYKRLEQRFLDRFTQMLSIGGILMFVVPQYALAASAKYLAQHYDQLHCYKFPEPDYSVFKQVVLIAKRQVANEYVSDSLIELVIGWADGTTPMPMLGDETNVFKLEKFKQNTLTLVATKIDLTCIAKHVAPWSGTKNFNMSLGQLFGKPMEVAMTPKPAHIAVALTTGGFNGKEILPNHDKPDKHPLLVKGVFSRAFRTVQENENSKGVVTSQVEVQQPRLKVYALDLKTYQYIELTDK